MNVKKTEFPNFWKLNDLQQRIPAKRDPINQRRYRHQTAMLEELWEGQRRGQLG
jgi:hypothetical protein